MQQMAGRHVVGVGMQTGQTFNLARILIFVTQDRAQIASKRNSVINRYLVSQEMYLSLILLVIFHIFLRKTSGKV